MAKRGRPTGTILARWECADCGEKIAAGENPVCANCGNDMDFKMRLGTCVRWPTRRRASVAIKPLLVLPDIDGQFFLFEAITDG